MAIDRFGKNISGQIQRTVTTRIMGGVAVHTYEQYGANVLSAEWRGPFAVLIERLGASSRKHRQGRWAT